MQQRGVDLGYWDFSSMDFEKKLYFSKKRKKAVTGRKKELLTFFKLFEAIPGVYL